MQSNTMRHCALNILLCFALLIALQPLETHASSFIDAYIAAAGGCDNKSSMNAFEQGGGEQSRPFGKSANAWTDEDISTLRAALGSCIPNPSIFDLDEERQLLKKVQKTIEQARRVEADNKQVASQQQPQSDKDVSQSTKAPETIPQSSPPQTVTPTESNKPHDVSDDLLDSLSERPKWHIDKNNCDVTATIDYDKFYERLPAFRSAWLNEDYTLENNRHHARQLLDLIIMPHMAALMTSAVYNNDTTKPSTDCHFTAGISYLDKFGQTQTFNAIKWDFTNKLAEKVNWAKFDESKFNEIAENWRYTKGADDFNQLEDPLSEDGKYHPLHQEEQQSGQQADASFSDILFNANATFIRATTFCRKNYMDSRAGYTALTGSKECFHRFDEATLKRAAMAAMKRLDDDVRVHGRRAACADVESLAREIDSGKR